jgi:histone acetyltransferase (RNA polymerase elongator complex component)
VEHEKSLRVKSIAEYTKNTECPPECPYCSGNPNNCYRKKYEEGEGL